VRFFVLSQLSVIGDVILRLFVAVLLSARRCKYKTKKKELKLFSPLFTMSFNSMGLFGTAQAVFLENSFISDFLDEAKLFWKKCLAK